MLLRLLRAHLGRYRGLIAVVVALQAVQTVAVLYLPALNADIVDKGIAEGDTGYIWRLGAWMLLVTAVQAVFNIGAIWGSAKVANAFGRDVRANLFHQVTGFSAREVGHFGAPSLITRITNDVQQVQLLVLMFLTLVVAAPITVIGGVVMALREDVGLSALLLVAVPALALGIGLVTIRLMPLYRGMQGAIDGVNRVLREQLTGIRVVRAFVREPEEAARFEAANGALTSLSLRAGRTQAFTFPIVMVALNLSSAAALWVGANRINAGEVQIGELIAFLSYLAQILLSVMMATFMFMLIPRASVSAQRIGEVLDAEPSVRAPAVPVAPRPDPRGLELRQVGFHYPGAAEPVLVDVSFTVRPGQTTAIVGSTGAGKTTLLSLVPRLFDVTGGAVLVDGVEVRDLEPEVLWSRIGLVPQKPYLFSGTVASNLRYADPAATDEQLWHALEIAQAAPFVTAMGGLDARVEQGGSNVSGGQRQRLAIARALVKRRGVYLFDDSFSALDLATDARLRAALAPEVAGAAVVIVAQRVSTIAHADQILVLEDGHQVGLGTHAELLAGCPTYAEIVSSQHSADERVSAA
jgi:ATP-binding cassette subfamily B protein